jgi:ATP-binding cassette subfamily B protein
MSMEQYEDDESARRRLLSNAQVLGFIAGYWRRRPWLVGATVTFTLAAIACELMVPRASKALVDAAVRGPAHADGAWAAWLFFVAVYFGFALLRNSAMRFWTPLAAWTMQEMTNEGFRRVQRFSADWHGDTFAGATVRRLSRAMWGYDNTADAIVLAIGPALLVLVGLSLQMILRWPLVGAFSLGMVGLYITANVVIPTSMCARPSASPWPWTRASAGRCPTPSRPIRSSRASGPRRARRPGSMSSPPTGARRRCGPGFATWTCG